MLLYGRQASVERDLEVIDSELNDSDFARLSTEGQSMTVEEAVRLARDFAPGAFAGSKISPSAR
jgi:hypothetical protein